MKDIKFECCEGICNQGRNCPYRERRPIPGTGIVRVALIIVGLVAIATGLAGWW